MILRRSILGGRFRAFPWGFGVHQFVEFCGEHRRTFEPVKKFISMLSWDHDRLTHHRIDFVCREIGLVLIVHASPFR
jgi:hypothetical protein